MQRIVIVFTILIIGCRSTSKVTTPNLIEEKNKDVIVLSVLIRDHLKQTHERDFNLNELIQNDTTKRISSNFESVKLKWCGGYISVYYKFSMLRDTTFQLTDKETAVWRKWVAKKIKAPYDGEIRFAYGERFYHIKKIIVKKEKH